MHAEFEQDAELWVRRPLEPEHMEYASLDVAYLDELHRKLLGQEQTKSISRDRLVEIWKTASDRHANLLRHNGEMIIHTDTQPSQSQ